METAAAKKMGDGPVASMATLLVKVCAAVRISGLPSTTGASLLDSGPFKHIGATAIFLRPYHEEFFRQKDA